MKILHTSDWHLGHKFFNQDRKEEHKHYLKYILKSIVNQKVDVVLISGDIFDSKYPSSCVEKMFYTFIEEIKKIDCFTFIIAGNHDSSLKISAITPLLKDTKVKIISSLDNIIENNIYTIKVKDIFYNFVAIPFVEDFELIQFYEKNNLNYNNCIMNLYKVHFSFLKNNNNYKTISMGHFTAESSGSKIQIDRKNTYNIDYVNSDCIYYALGHLHKNHRVGKSNFYYCGSLISCNFHSSHYGKTFNIVNFDKFSNIESVQSHKMDDFIKIETLKGTFSEVQSLLTKDNQLSWIQVILKEDRKIRMEEKSTLERIADNNNKLILKIVLESDALKNINSFNKDFELFNVRDKKPMDFFNKLLEINNYNKNIDAKNKILSVFNDMLNSVKKY